MKLGWLVVVALAATACGGKKKRAPASSDAGAPMTSGAAIARCVSTLERAAALPAAERAGTLVRGCAVCGSGWDPVIAADRADTGGPVDLEEIWRIVQACGGVCNNTTAGNFKAQLAELLPGKPTSRPWRALAEGCPAQLNIDDSSARFASGAWYALATIGSKLHLARAGMPAAEQTKLDAALASMLVVLPPVTAPGTGFIVPGGAQRPGTPWRHITVTADAVFVGRLAFAHLSSHGLGIADASEPYPGAKLAALSGLAAALEAQVAPGAPPPPPLADRIAEPVIIAPRAAAARLVTDTVAALGSHQAFLAVASPAPAALWRGIVAAHPLALAATAPAGPRLRFGLVSSRVAVVDDQGVVLASSPLPLEDRPMVERWVAVANRLARGRTVEVIAEDGKVDALAALLDAAGGGAAARVVPAPDQATLSGRDLPAFDAVKLAAVLGAAP